MDVTRLIVCAAMLLEFHAYCESQREPDITVTAPRVIDSWSMSYDDMEFVTRVIDCGQRLYDGGQREAALPYLRMGAGYGDVDSQFRGGQYAAARRGRGRGIGPPRSGGLARRPTAT